jgi:plastocyanin
MSPGKLTEPIVVVLVSLTLVLAVVAPGVVLAHPTTTSGDTQWKEFGLFIGGVNQSLLEQEQLQNNLHLMPTHWTVSIVPGASDMGDRAYSPDSVNIRSGDIVKWINDDTQFHTVTSGAGLSDSMKGNEFDSGLSAPNALTRNGKTFSHTFMRSGEFPYFCQLHPTMVVKVVVSNSDENPNTERSQQQLSEKRSQEQTPNIDTGTFDSYNNSTYGINIDYPSDWTLQGGNKSGTLTDIVSFFSPENDSYIVLTISVEEISNNESLEKYRSDSVDGYLNNTNFQNFVLSDDTDRLYWADPLSGHRAYKIVGTYQDPETKSTQKIMEIGTITGENLAYTIRFYADPAKYSFYLPTIQKMIDSFQINNSGVQAPVVPEESPTINGTMNQLPEKQPNLEQQQANNTEPNPSSYSGINWSDKCQLVQSALYQSCDVLVNPDGSLTDQGRHAMHCIRNGALLGGGAKALVPGLPTWLILKGLDKLAGMTGCDGIVKMDALNGLGGLCLILHLLP